MYELNDLHTKRYFGIFPVDYFGYFCPLNLSTRYNNETDEEKCKVLLSEIKDLIIYLKIMSMYLMLWKKI